MIQQFKLVGPVENGRMLAGLFAIITAHTDVIIVGQCLFHILQLVIFPLLRTKHIKSIELDLLYNVGITLSPTIPGQRIRLIRIPDIIGCKHIIFSLQAIDTTDQKEQGPHDSLHHISQF